jgi:ribosomal protein L16/L10AE
MPTLKEIREKNKTKTSLDKLKEDGEKLKAMDYSDIKLSKEDIDLKNICIESAKQIAQKYLKEDYNK